MKEHHKRVRIVLFLLAFAGLLWAAGQMSKAHYHTYWPDQGNGYGKRGQTTTWTYFWGHPYEKVVFDALLPKCFAVLPDGKQENISLRQVRMQDPATREMRRAFMFSYKPGTLGDHYVCMKTPAYFQKEEGIFIQDMVKQPLHVGIEKGWERPVGMEVEMVPLTRPYGQEEGCVFKAQVLHNGKPLAGAAVEVEKFNGFPVQEKELPRDPFGDVNVPLITRTARTDCNGYVVCVLDEPGWWILSASVKAGEKEREGEKYPVEKRAGIWIHMESRFVQKRSQK